jgi:hypothetical protein
VIIEVRGFGKTYVCCAGPEALQLCHDFVFAALWLFVLLMNAPRQQFSDG